MAEHRTKTEGIADGLWGLLVGDALGVPYEFHPPEAVPQTAEIEFWPPAGYDRSYPDVPPGTWSDDGAQALCLLDSLLCCGRLDLNDFATRMLRWVDSGLWTADGRVFDCGVQTMSSLRAFAGGMPPEMSGSVVPDGKGNGALMRVLPLALWHVGSDEALVEDAHLQCLPTHGHVCNQVCCALYCLWARRLLAGEAPGKAYDGAVSFLERYYGDQPAHLRELECAAAEGTPTGTGYVVDSIRSAKYVVMGFSTYEAAVRAAVALGNDTDTTAAIAGGLAGLAYGGIPARWSQNLRGADKVGELLDKLFFGRCDEL